MLVQQNKLRGRGVLLTGPIGSGKSALAHAFALSLNQKQKEKYPYVQVSASELYKHDISLSEAITQAVRKSINVQINEETEMVIGEVVSISVADSGSGDKSSSIVLKTDSMESKFDIGQKFLEVISRENICAGDVVSIDKTSGRFLRLGRSRAAELNEVVGSTLRIVDQPKGELITRCTVEHNVTLHEMDVINSKATGFMSLFNGQTGEISQEVRNEVDKKVNIWIQEERCTVTSGVLFIDEAHILDMQAFAFLNNVIENDHSPIIILSTNRKQCKIRGTQIDSQYGIPQDFLDRLLIIETEPLTQEELENIVQLRIEEKQIEMDDQAIKMLGKVAYEKSIRYATQLLDIINQIAKENNKRSADIDCVKQSMILFCDQQTSFQALKDNQDQYMYNDSSKYNQVGIEYQDKYMNQQ